MRLVILPEDGNAKVELGIAYSKQKKYIHKFSAFFYCRSIHIGYLIYAMNSKKALEANQNI